MRVLYAGNNFRSDAVIAKMLLEAGFIVFHKDSGQSTLNHLGESAYDLVLVNLASPAMSGQLLVQKIREKQITTPVILLANAADGATTAEALDLGADDCVGKPFNHKTLLARIHATIRRSYGHAQSVITCGNLRVDISNQQVTVDQAVIELTTNEYLTLERLMLRKDKQVSRRVLSDCVNHHNGTTGDKGVDVIVCKLRKKLNAASDLIETVWSRGYMLRSPKNPNSSEEL